MEAVVSLHCIAMFLIFIFENHNILTFLIFCVFLLFKAAMIEAAVAAAMIEAAVAATEEEVVSKFATKMVSVSKNRLGSARSHALIGSSSFARATDASLRQPSFEIFSLGSTRSWHNAGLGS